MTNKRKAIWFGCLPPALFIGNIVLYAILNFVGSAMTSSAAVETESAFGTSAGFAAAPSLGEMILRMINMLQGLLGIIFLIAIPVGIIMAIIMANKEEGPQQQPPTQPPVQQ